MSSCSASRTCVETLAHPLVAQDGRHRPQHSGTVGVVKHERVSDRVEVDLQAVHVHHPGVRPEARPCREERATSTAVASSSAHRQQQQQQQQQHLSTRYKHHQRTPFPAILLQTSFDRKQDQKQKQTLPAKPGAATPSASTSEYRQPPTGESTAR